MGLNSLIFLFLFLPLFTGIVLLLKKDTVFKKYFIIIFSLAFYFWGGRQLTVIIISLFLINFFLIKVLFFLKGRSVSGLLFRAGIAFNVLVLIFYKYTVFIFKEIGLNTDLLPDLAPLGISFIVFQSVSMLFDSHRSGKDVSFTDSLYYFFFFPKLITGPIALFKDFLKKTEGSLTDNIYAGLLRFVQGLGKKMLIADSAALIANPVFAIPPGEQTILTAWLGAIAYTVQIFFDFSGYSDMAIGLGRMAGIVLPENFNYPYFSKSIKEFWQRWHISLAVWLREYLFLPTAFTLSDALKKRKYLGIKSDTIIYSAATVITFFLCGVWHGANWTFFVWGLFYGVLLVIERAGLTKFLKKKASFLQRPYTMLMVIVGWVIFRSSDLTGSWLFLKAMAGFGSYDYNLHPVMMFLDSELVFWLLAGILFSFPVLKPLSCRFSDSKLMLPVAYVFHVLMFIVSVAAIVTGSYTPFIYFRF